MKIKQIIILLVAFLTAIVLAFVGRGLFAANEPVVAQTEIIKAEPTVDILIAAADIPAGSSLEVTRLAWQELPLAHVNDTFITRDLQPDAIEQYSPLIARSVFFAGDPIREKKLLRSDSGYLSLILPAGKRAVAVRVEAESSAGGFILPKDRVDIIMSYRTQNNRWITETILENILVLAIDALVEEKDGEKNQIGDTATLEVTPQQAEILIASKNLADNRLTLALRSVADSNRYASKGAQHLLEEPVVRKQPNINLVRYGVLQNVRIKK